MKEILSVELATRAKHLVWTETVLLAFINVVAFFGNLLTCYAVYRDERRRRLLNMFVIALGLSDILMFIFCRRFTVVTLGCFTAGGCLATVLVDSTVLEHWHFDLCFFRLLIAVSHYCRFIKPEKYTVLFKKLQKTNCCTVLLLGA